jgi:hypothetical protein
MFARKITALTVLMLAGFVCAYAADITGKWTAQFNTQIGVQKYIYEFKVEGTKLTGKAIANIEGTESQSNITEGTINGDDVSFVEMQKYQGQEIRIVYKGKVSGDEIKFTRTVTDSINEELVAKRAK